MNKINRWIPFIFMLTMALISIFYLVFYGTTESYKPFTDNPAVIYREACARCHGNKGEGSQVLYPALQQSGYTVNGVKETIESGTWLMPGFKNIKGDTLTNLAEYIIYNKYLDK